MNIEKFEAEQVITMSSLEIVELINQTRSEDEAELRHDHFMVKVPKVLGTDVAPKFLGTAPYENGTGGTVNRKVYNFPKREACLMAMSYSYELQATIYDRMTALEQKQQHQFKLPQNYKEALEHLLIQVEKNEVLVEQNKQLESEMAEAIPKILLAEALLEADSGIRIGDFARVSSDTYGLGRNKMYLKLREWGVIDCRNQPYQRCIDSGWFYTVERPFSKGDYTGINIQVWITPKGQRYIINRLKKENII